MLVRRLIARLLDWLLVLVVAWPLAHEPVLVVLCAAVYDALLLRVNTLGKALTGLRVVGPASGLSLRRVLARTLITTALPGAGAVLVLTGLGLRERADGGPRLATAVGRHRRAPRRGVGRMARLASAGGGAGAAGAFRGGGFGFARDADMARPSRGHGRGAAQGGRLAPVSNEVEENHGNVVQAREVGSVHIAAPVPPTTALNGLPPCSSFFCGRDSELAELAEHRVVVVSGLGGIGKTELVLRFAEDNDFPGGRLFWNFHGYDASKRTGPSQALASFLRALGVTEVPPAEADMAMLYRSLVSVRDPMLIVLDNVSTAAQIRALMVAKHHVVVTSRHLLTGLDAHQLELRVLPEPDAERITGDAEIAKLCGRLPLALQIMSALRKTDPGHSWAEELREVRLNLLRHDDLDVRAVFDLSYRALTLEQRRFFRLVAMHRLNVITAETAAAFAAVSVTEARTRLRELRVVHLLEQDSKFHDLIQDFADEQRDREDTVQDVIAAGERYIGRCGHDRSPDWRILVWASITKLSGAGHVDSNARTQAIQPYLPHLNLEFFESLGKATRIPMNCNASCSTRRQ
ncbi:hypothetical protein FXN61_08285 [Lentzea sp. PSKA42]|uniref:NB-ARC domain-containing protein n=1 Tax=Lentzea indica TaxID=2604800 RepID=A0ABX1FD14_9PSEU|nr:hypothetical protein [Lentzea indica]NKE56834.1 hypothetical protein [Lentzea indica]